MNNQGSEPQKSGKAKLEEVTVLLNELRADLNRKTLEHQQRKKKLERLKVYGRDPSNSDPIFTKDGIATIAKLAFDSNSSIDASREALSCLANAMLLKESTRVTFADMQLFGQVTERLKSGASHDEFLICRILFLITYAKSVAFEKIVSENHIADVLNEKIVRHANRYATQSNSKANLNPMDDTALNEVCQLVFNITALNPKLATSFSGSLVHLYRILNQSQGIPPLKQPIPAVINALLNLGPEGESWGSLMFPETDSCANVTILVSILDAATTHYEDSEINKLAIPLVTLIHKVYTAAPPNVKEFSRTRLLPSDADRDQVLGKSGSLASRLLRLTTSASAPELRDSISGMLFELSDKDPEKYVRNVGFGYASGFLMNNGFPLPTAASGGRDSSGADINPVTGQRREAEVDEPLPPMTDEEKEREAERLFVLFERLNKTGVMKVKNPVQEAVEQGRFEELPD